MKRSIRLAAQTPWVAFLLFIVFPLASVGQTTDERMNQAKEAIQKRQPFNIQNARDNLRRQNLDYEIWKVGTPNAAKELSHGMELLVGVGVRVLGAAPDDDVAFYAGVAKRGSNEAIAISERFEGKGPGPHLLQFKVAITDEIMSNGRFNSDVILLQERRMPGLPGQNVVLKQFIEDKDLDNHRQPLVRDVVKPEISFARVGRMGSNQTVEPGAWIQLRVTARMRNGGPARQGISFAVGDPEVGRIDATGPKVYRQGDGDFPEVTMRVRVQPERIEDGMFRTTLFVLRDSAADAPFDDRVLTDSNPDDNQLLIAYNVFDKATAPVEGYVLTHEHPTNGMAFGGNYAFAGADGNYRHGIMEKGYTAACSGCKVGGLCDHGEVKGSFAGFTGSMGRDMGDHSSHYGPVHNSNSHLRYSTEWVREAFLPSEQKYRDARMRIMVAFAVENEAMCEQLYYVNKGGGGPGGDGYGCSKGDSFNSLKRQLDSLKLWAAENANWMEIAYSAADARRIVNENKLAIVLGVEAEYAFGAENRTFDPVDRLNTYYDLGVRTFYLAHKINSRLAGADIYFPKNTMPGKAIRTIQALAGCFYYDDNVRHFPLEGRLGNDLCDNNCGANAFKGGKVTDACAYKLSDISEVNMLDYLATRGAGQFNGFELYPKTPGFDGKGGSFERKGVEYNNLGLSYEGERVVREAMMKGMIVNIDHVSGRARDDIYSLATDVFDNYPLNALHNKPNDRLTNRGKATVDSVGRGDDPRYLNTTGTYWKHEYDIDGDELDYIKRTGGFFGLRMGPTDSVEYEKSGITVNCPDTSTETAKMLAWLLDRGLSVGYSLDYGTVTQGVHSRSFAKCGENLGKDNFDTYGKHRAEGLSHIGMMKKWHAELEAIGLREKYVQQLKTDGAEAFITMWEKSEAASGSGGQVPRVVITPTVKPH